MQANLSKRHGGLDAGRATAILAVLAIHSFHPPEAKVAEWLVNSMSRFAVPFFFILSGYLLSQSLERVSPRDPAAVAVHSVKRIGALFAFWSAVYFLDPPFTEISLTGFAESYLARGAALAANPWRAIAQGTQYHLWFFPALIIAHCGLAFLFFLGARASFLSSVAALLLAAGLLIGPYRHLIAPTDLPEWLNGRDGIFLGLPYVLVGSVVAKKPPSLRQSIALAVVGLVIFVGESWMYRSLRGDWSAPDFGIGSLPFALGVFGIFHSMDLTEHPVLGKAALIGPLVPGVYAIHILIYNRIDGAAAHFGTLTSAVWGWLAPVIILTASMAICSIAAKIPMTRRFFV